MNRIEKNASSSWSLMMMMMMMVYKVVTLSPSSRHFFPESAERNSRSYSYLLRGLVLRGYRIDFFHTQNFLRANFYQTNHFFHCVLWSMQTMGKNCVTLSLLKKMVSLINYMVQCTILIEILEEKRVFREYCVYVVTGIRWKRSSFCVVTSDPRWQNNKR